MKKIEISEDDETLFGKNLTSFIHSKFVNCQEEIRQAIDQQPTGFWIQFVTSFRSFHKRRYNCKDVPDRQFVSFLKLLTDNRDCPYNFTILAESMKQYCVNYCVPGAGAYVTVNETALSKAPKIKIITGFFISSIVEIHSRFAEAPSIRKRRSLAKWKPPGHWETLTDNLPSSYEYYLKTTYGEKLASMLQIDKAFLPWVYVKKENGTDTNLPNSVENEKLVISVDVPNGHRKDVPNRRHKCSHGRKNEVLLIRNTQIITENDFEDIVQVSKEEVLHKKRRRRKKNKHPVKEEILVMNENEEVTLSEQMHLKSELFGSCDSFDVTTNPAERTNENNYTELRNKRNEILFLQKVKEPVETSQTWVTVDLSKGPLKIDLVKSKTQKKSNGAHNKKLNGELVIENLNNSSKPKDNTNSKPKDDTNSKSKDDTNSKEEYENASFKNVTLESNLKKAKSSKMKKDTKKDVAEYILAQAEKKTASQCDASKVKNGENKSRVEKNNTKKGIVKNCNKPESLESVSHPASFSENQSSGAVELKETTLLEFEKNSETKTIPEAKQANSKSAKVKKECNLQEKIMHKSSADSPAQDRTEKYDKTSTNDKKHKVIDEPPSEIVYNNNIKNVKSKEGVKKNETASPQNNKKSKSPKAQENRKGNISKKSEVSCIENNTQAKQNKKKSVKNKENIFELGHESKEKNSQEKLKKLSLRNEESLERLQKSVISEEPNNPKKVHVDSNPVGSMPVSNKIHSGGGGPRNLHSEEPAVHENHNNKNIPETANFINQKSDVSSNTFQNVKSLPGTENHRYNHCQNNEVFHKNEQRKTRSDEQRSVDENVSEKNNSNFDLVIDLTVPQTTFKFPYGRNNIGPMLERINEESMYTGLRDFCSMPRTHDVCPYLLRKCDICKELESAPLQHKRCFHCLKTFDTMPRLYCSELCCRFDWDNGHSSCHL